MRTALGVMTLLMLTAAVGRSQVTDGFVTADDGTRLYYRIVGTGRDTAIAPGGFLLAPEFERLARAGDRAIVFYDMRNRGRSARVVDSAQLSIHADVADLEAVRRHVGVDRPALIGYSYLGLMVVMYAMEHPQHVARLIQLGPVPLHFETSYPPGLRVTDPEPVDSAAWAQLQELRRSGVAASRPREFCEQEWAAVRVRLVGNPANAVKLASRCELENEWPINLQRHFRFHFTSVRQLTLSRERVARVTVPVLTIHGTRDRNAPYGAGREWALLLPQARLLTVAGAAHASWVDAPETVFPAVAEFLGGSWPGAAEKVTRLVP